ncbi:MAG: hypothetical protein J4F32_01610 [Dehalococcoidia bacterium]|nr:hypothetical protein [Dehalococcoidia bacterium]
MRFAGVYLMLSGFAVAAYFILTAVIQADWELSVWEVIDWFMAAGALLALGIGWLQKREMESDGDSGLAHFITVNATFYAAAALFILFFWKWFAAVLFQNEDDSGVSWAALDVLYTLVAMGLGRRLWNNK